MDDLRDSAADYRQRGPIYSRAWEILSRKCEVPPSVEVFDHELEHAREGKGRYRGKGQASLTVIAHAQRVADSYHRTAFSVPDDVE
jgi:hypothetical protein